jgi:hypothetical protein
MKSAQLVALLIAGLAVYMFTGQDEADRISEENRLALMEVGSAGLAKVVHHSALATASSGGNAFDHYARAGDFIGGLEPEGSFGSSRADWPTEQPELDRAAATIRAATRALEHGATRATGRMHDLTSFSGIDYHYLTRVTQYRAYNDYFHGYPKRATKQLTALAQLHHDVARVPIDGHVLVVGQPAPSIDLLRHFVREGRLDASTLRSLENDLMALSADKPKPRELILAYLASLARSVANPSDMSTRTDDQMVSPDQWAAGIVAFHRNIDALVGIDVLSPLMAEHAVDGACRDAGLLEDNDHGCQIPNQIIRRYHEELVAIDTLLAEVRTSIESKS